MCAAAFFLYYCPIFNRSQFRVVRCRATKPYPLPVQYVCFEYATLYVVVYIHKLSKALHLLAAAAKLGASDVTAHALWLTRTVIVCLQRLRTSS
eukprot:6213710-Pleurochrysis_carterae.AAC.2